MSEERGRERGRRCISRAHSLVLAPQFAGNALNLNKLRLCKQGPFPLSPFPPLRLRRPTCKRRREEDGPDLQMNRTPPKDKQERSSRGEGPPSVRLCHATSPTPISLHKNLQLNFKPKTESLNDASALAYLLQFRLFQTWPRSRSEGIIQTVVIRI